MTFIKHNEGTKAFQRLVSSVSQEGQQSGCKKQADPFSEFLTVKACSSFRSVRVSIALISSVLLVWPF
jgi:hypothetical protein